MSPDNEPIKNHEAAERSEIERVKGLIKQDDLIFRTRNVDNSGSYNIDDKESELIRSFGLEKVETVQQMFDAMNDPNRNHDVPREKLDILATAFCESIIESGRKDIVIAGSSSIERQLSRAGFDGRDKKSEAAPSFAFMVAEKFRERIEAGEKRDTVTSVMEYLDFVKNNPEYAEDGGLEEVVAQAENTLSKIRPNVLKKDEMEAYADLKKYVLSLRSKDNTMANNSGITEAAEKLVQAAEKLSKSAEDRVNDSEFKKMIETVVKGRRRTGHKADFIPPEDYVPGSSFEEDGAEAKYYSRYDITALALATSMKVMDPDGARFDSYRPTEWYKALPKEVQNAIDVMIEINGAAASTYYYGKDLEKLVGSKRNFSFTSEKMRVLFNDDFKLGMSKMLNDLCEEYTDQNGYSCLRYKERFYKLTEYSTVIVNGIEKKVPILGSGETTENGFLMRSAGVDKDGNVVYRRVEIPQTRENEKKGALALDQDIIARLDFIEDYKEEIALFLAQQHGDEGFVRYSEDQNGHKQGEFILNERGERIPKPIYQMYAYTAWNLWYGMGDSSVADRMRLLPTWDKIVSDAIRTLNPEYKALGKMMIFKTGRPREAGELIEAEFFSGEISDYVISMMGIEGDIGPIDGVKTMRQKILDGKTSRNGVARQVKTMRQKILDGELELFPDKMLYGFLDFFNGGRDLVKPEAENGKEVKFFEKGTAREDKLTLAQLLMNYGYRTVVGPDGKSEGTFDASNKKDFNFKRNQTTFMNEFRDSYEAAVLVGQAMTGKLDAKDPGKWARQLKSAFGMVSQIWFNGERVLNNYTTSPWLWRSMMVGTFGADKSRFSSDYIPIVKPETKIKDYKQPYSFAVYNLIDSFGLSGVDIIKLMQLLGVDVRRGDHPRGAIPRIRTDAWEERDRNRTRKISNRLNKDLKKSEGVDRNSFDEIVSRLSRVYAADYDFSMLKRAYERAVSSGKSKLAETLVKKMKEQFPVP